MSKNELLLRTSRHGRGKMKFELDLSNYATKFDLKWATDINESEYAKKFDLVGSKSDVDKLETSPVGLSKLSDVVNIEVIEKKSYDKLVKKFDTFGSKKQNLKKKRLQMLIKIYLIPVKYWNQRL